MIKPSKKLSEKVEKALDRYYSTEWYWMVKKVCPLTGLVHLRRGSDVAIGYDTKGAGWYAMIDGVKGTGKSPMKAWKSALARRNSRCKKVEVVSVKY